MGCVGSNWCGFGCGVEISVRLWVLFRFVVGCVGSDRCGFGCGVEIGVGLWVCRGFCLGLSWVVWVWIAVGDRCLGDRR